MKQLLSKLLFKLFSWKVIGSSSFPKRCLIVSAPHTSNWDFFIGMCYAYIIALEPKFLIKSELFLPFFGSLLRWQGGIPVFRNSNHNVVDQVTEMFKNSSKLNLVITPEGTRSYVDKWKTGFYHIAINANIPILLLKMDYENKEIGVINEFLPTGNFINDMNFIEDKYKKIKGKIPEYYNTDIL